MAITTHGGTTDAADKPAGVVPIVSSAGLAACVAQWRDIQKRKRDFALEAKHRGQDIAANIAMQVSNAYGYCADRLECEMAANARGEQPPPSTTKGTI